MEQAASGPKPPNPRFTFTVEVLPLGGVEEPPVGVRLRMFAKTLLRRWRFRLVGIGPGLELAEKGKADGRSDQNRVV
jgi:hypothetical protein